MKVYSNFRQKRPEKGGAVKRVLKRIPKVALLLVIPAGLIISLYSLFAKRDVYFSIQDMIVKKEFKKVEALTKKLYKIDPSDVRALRFMGLNYYLQGLKFDYEQGVRVDKKSRYQTDHFKNTQSEEGWTFYKKAVESLKKAILADRKQVVNSRDYMVIGFSYSRWGDAHFKKALRYLEKSEEMNRKDSVLSDSDMPAFSLESLFRQKGYIHYRVGNYTNALQCFENANKIDRKVLNYLYIAHCARALDRTKDAIRYYRKVVDYSQDKALMAGCMEMLGGIYLQTRQYREAEEYFKKGISVNSNSASSYFGLSLVAEARGNRARAKKFWKLTLKADPHYGPAILRMRNSKGKKKKG